METVALCRLRAALANHFEGVERTLRRLREAGLLPAGTPGRDGAGSAQITPQQAVLILLALASGAAPVDAPAEARRLGDFVLRYLDDTHVSGPRQRRYITTSLRLLDVLAGEIIGAAGGLEDHQPSSWAIGPDYARQLLPQRLTFCPAVVALGEDHHPLVVRETIIHARLLAEVAALFAPMSRLNFTPAETGAAAAMLGLR